MASAFRRADGKANRTSNFQQSESSVQSSSSSPSSSTSSFIHNIKRRDNAKSSPSPYNNNNNNNNNNNSNNSVKTPFLFRLKGVKPWQGGAYLTSVGLNDLDNIVGGGQILGTCILLEEDRLKSQDLAITLVKYWCAEAMSQEQHLLVPLFSRKQKASSDNEDVENDGKNFPSSLSFLYDDDLSVSSSDDDAEILSENAKNELEDILSSLPRNLHWDKQKKKEARAKQREQEEITTNQETGGFAISSGLASITILEEEEEDGDESEEKNDAILQNAWQYKKSVQQERGNTMNLQSRRKTSEIVNDVFCHSYDLSRRMIDQIPVDVDCYLKHLPTFIKASKLSCIHTKAYKLFCDLVGLLKEKLTPLACNDNSNKAVRLLLYHPPIEMLAIALPLLLAYIRKESLPVVIMISTTPTDDVKSCIRLARTCDVVLSTEGFASRKEYPPPPEFRHLQGVLKVSKTTRKRCEIAASIFGFKRDRRKLHIPLLHIPPEDYADGGGSVSGGVRSGAGRPASSLASSSGNGLGCSHSGSGSSVLDF